MPLTIAGSDIKKGTITLVIQEVGLSSTRLCELNEGDYITAVSYTHLTHECEHPAFPRHVIYTGRAEETECPYRNYLY